jgi:hypothetical protein
MISDFRFQISRFLKQKNLITYYLLLITFIFASCQENYTPKRNAYFELIFRSNEISLLTTMPPVRFLLNMLITEKFKKTLPIQQNYTSILAGSILFFRNTKPKFI